MRRQIIVGLAMMLGVSWSPVVLAAERVDVSTREDVKQNEHLIRTYPDGSQYDGQVRDGKFHGQGVYTGADGPTYDGQFRAGKLDGQGVLTFPDGASFAGRFRAGKCYGQGVYTRATGERMTVASWLGPSGGKG